MNPLTNVKNIQKLNQRELELGNFGKKSWHDEYKDSAWVFIGGLPYDLTEGDIICVFSQYGEVVNFNLVRDKSTGKSKGFAFLCYEDQRSTVLAVDNLNSIKLLGRIIRVDHVADYKKPKEHGDEDEVTKKLRADGCAPSVPETPADKGEEGLPSDKAPITSVTDKRKQKKKKKKEEKKKKKKVKKEKRERRSASVDSNSSDQSNSSGSDSVKGPRHSDSSGRDSAKGHHSNSSGRDVRQRGYDRDIQQQGHTLPYKDSGNQQDTADVSVKIKREKHDSGYDRAVFGHRKDVSNESASRQRDSCLRMESRRERESTRSDHHQRERGFSDGRYHHNRQRDSRSDRDRSPVERNSHSRRY